MRGTPTRAPYSPWLSLPGERSPLRKVRVSWSESKESATAQRAPPGHAAGLSDRPARTFSTIGRQRSSGHVQGSGWAGWESGIGSWSVLLRRRSPLGRLLDHGVADPRPQSTPFSARAGSSPVHRWSASPACWRRTLRWRHAASAAQFGDVVLVQRPGTVGWGSPAEAGRLPREVSAARVNCETTSRLPETSTTERFIGLSTSANTRSASVFSARARGARRVVIVEDAEQHQQSLADARDLGTVDGHMGVAHTLAQGPHRTARAMSANPRLQGSSCRSGRRITILPMTKKAVALISGASTPCWRQRSSWSRGSRSRD